MAICLRSSQSARDRRAILIANDVEMIPKCIDLRHRHASNINRRCVLMEGPPHGIHYHATVLLVFPLAGQVVHAIKLD